MERKLYLALGDSITRGFSATNPANTFVNQVSGNLKRLGICTDSMVIAQNGWTTQNLWRVCRTVPDSVWKQSAVLTLMVGGNDLRRRYYTVFSHPTPSDVVARTIQEFEYTLNLICHHISDFDIPYVMLPTLYNPVPHSQLATLAITRVNEVIQGCAERHAFDVVPVDRAFIGKEAELVHRYRTGRIEDLSIPFARPIHPNNAGHQVIANEILRHIENRFKPASALTNTAR